TSTVRLPLMVELPDVTVKLPPEMSRAAALTTAPRDVFWLACWMVMPDWVMTAMSAEVGRTLPSQLSGLFQLKSPALPFQLMTAGAMRSSSTSNESHGRRLGDRLLCAAS